jgi:hypothetical protein
MGGFMAAVALTMFAAAWTVAGIWIGVWLFRYGSSLG